MGALFNLVLLVAASAGSLAFGVLAAYGIFKAGFALMRTQSQASTAKAPAGVKAQSEAARVS